MWYCTSSRSHTTVAKYAEYIATSFKEAKERLGDKFSINPKVKLMIFLPIVMMNMILFRLNKRQIQTLVSQAGEPSSSGQTVISQTRRSGDSRSRS